MVAVPPLSTTSSQTRDEDARFLLRGVPWNVYVALRDALDDAGSRVRMTYLEGNLELVSPSGTHEESTVILTDLLRAWALERDVDLRGFRSTTFRSEARQRGVEADACYTLGPLVEGGVPALAIETIVTNPLVDKLDVYAGLGVLEVWAWYPRTAKLVIHTLVDGQYAIADRSVVLADLDVEQLLRFVRPGENQNALIREYIASLR